MVGENNSLYAMLVSKNGVFHTLDALDNHGKTG
jgi:hypothetical protein